MNSRNFARERPVVSRVEPGRVNMTTIRATWDAIVSDLRRYRATDGRGYFTMLIICPGAVAGIVYRVGHWIWCYSGRLSPLVRLLRAPYILALRWSEILTGITIRPQAEIGRGLYIGHSGGIHIGQYAVLGENCNISQEVTIGVAGRGSLRGTPHIGDRCYIGAGAKLFGSITIGCDVAVGANAVVTKSVPDRAVVGGIPAKVISLEGSFDFVLYEGLETDPERLESLRLRDSDKRAADEHSERGF